MPRILDCDSGIAVLPDLAGTVERVASLDAALDTITTHSPADVVVLAVREADAREHLGTATWRGVLRDTPVLLVLPEVDDIAADALIAAGVQDVLGAAEAADAAALARRLRFAIARKQLERDARKTWSTDLDTGLPNREQLLEHLNQMLALRARQPAPMAVLALRLDGLDAVAAQHGAEGAQLVCRKVAVRLRAAVRASDIVASLGGGAFALLLSKIEAAADAQRVALKLARALREPFNVLGAAVGVGAHVGVALHPGDGSDAEPLLRHARAAALAAGRRRTGAANDG